MKGRPEISLDPGSCILGALCILLLPLSWNLGYFLASAVHEAAHLLVLLLLDIPVTYLRISPVGAIIGTGPMTRLQELASTAAGPAGSFSLLILAHRFPEVALIGAVQGVFNMLPIYPFDGGRILRIIFSIFPVEVQKKLEALARIVAVFLLTGAVLAGILLFTRWKLWIFSGSILILRRAFRKIPCKDAAADVQ